MNVRFTIRWLALSTVVSILFLLSLGVLTGVRHLRPTDKKGPLAPATTQVIQLMPIVQAAVVITAQTAISDAVPHPAMPPKLADIHQLAPLAELLQGDKSAVDASASTLLSSEPYLLADYAAQCKAYMGTVPDFSCTELTHENNILHAEVITPDKTAGVCPQLGNDERCVITGTVEGRLITPTDVPANTQVTILFSCRRYDASTPSGRFDDIAVIQHDSATGNTCWFQSPTVLDFDRKGKSYTDRYGNDVYKDWAGEHVPSPMGYGAQNFWLHPYHPDEVIDYNKNHGIDDMRAGKRGIVASMDCQRCHDADPFVWSPYFLKLSQTHVFTASGTAIDGWNPSGNYVSGSFGLFNADGKERQQALRFDPDGNPCSACHEFGTRTMSPTQNDRVAHLLDLLNTDTNKDRAWMPPADALSAYPTLTPTTFNLLQGCAVSTTGTYTDSAGTLVNCNRHLPEPTIRPNIILATDAEPAILTAGHEVQYSIHLRNQGIYTIASTATGIQVLDRLPTGVTPIQTPEGCELIVTDNHPSLSCQVDALAHQEAVTITFRAMVAPTENASHVTNIVQVQTPATNDNIATIQSRIEHYVRRNADLAVQQAAVLETVPGVSPAQFKLKYTLMAANSGPAVAANVLITQVLPVGALYDAALSSTRCTETTAHSGIIRCNLNELNDGRSSVLNLIATIPAAQGPFFPSQVLVASSAPDPNAVNNRVSTVLFDRVSVAQLYLPVAFAVRQRAPDLVVKEIRITPENAEVVIQNIGDTPLLPTDRFWVDLYINPNPPPTGVNQTIQERQSDGLVWGVISPTLQLAPGAAYTLRFGDHYYDHDQSSVPAQIKAGSVIYVQVDSANLESDAGGVLEEHEMAGGASNNIAVIAIGETISTLNWKTAHHEQRTNAASRNAALLLR